MDITFDFIFILFGIFGVIMMICMVLVIQKTSAVKQKKAYNKTTDEHIDMLKEMNTELRQQNRRLQGKINREGTLQDDDEVSDKILDQDPKEIMELIKVSGVKVPFSEDQLDGILQNKLVRGYLKGKTIDDVQGIIKIVSPYIKPQNGQVQFAGNAGQAGYDPQGA